MLQQYASLPDCFGRVFALIDPEPFAACFRQWSASVAELLPDEVVAVDGKRVRRLHDRRKGLAALHLVSAWATANRVVLGQVATEAKSNEITAIPPLLQWLTLEGCLVTIDAMGCQTKIAEQIIAQGGDDVLSLKGNLETRYFIGSIGTSAARFTHAVRGHWGIENELHWTFDLSFREDECGGWRPSMCFRRRSLATSGGVGVIQAGTLSVAVFTADYSDVIQATTERTYQKVSCRDLA
ncbi:MAG: ISAs1 family transposase [Lamprobacter sp.]|uniref:ISAs1 family transposase n=1 Tax=Lamprobacter sp. TaxID=3100796 RepID=UPI002B25C21C|nr:ISAs1 family transposase [Lamprobacter sp.]MEA3642098.1 ISAs1 family transposase [Lamprobacter sp.]